MPNRRNKDLTLTNDLKKEKTKPVKQTDDEAKQTDTGSETKQEENL
jgi:hypothetical protein